MTRMEQYSWRDEEAKLNASVPQFRCSIDLPSQSPLRIHFVHARSTHANAVPLLLIPPFPFSNLSLGHLIDACIEPDDAATTQPFHLVIPSLPGLGFSDALPNDLPVIPTVVQMLDALMKRLDYPLYIASNSGSSASSPADIDWRIMDHLATNYQASCLGTHMISPPLSPPRLREAPLEWAKWKVSSSLDPVGGYTNEDVSAWRRTKSKSKRHEAPFGLAGLSSDPEPNTLGYALCDSPTGLLLFVLMMLRTFDTQTELSPMQIITLTELLWLPGPEAMLRFWVYCASHEETRPRRLATKPTVGLTVFMGNDKVEDDANSHLKPRKRGYACPQWAKSRYNTVSLERISGNAGAVLWERPEVIVNGARGVARVILQSDKRMQAASEPGIALLEQVVVEGGRPALAEISGTTMQASTPDVTGKPRLSGQSASRPVEISQTSSGHLLPKTPEGQQGPRKPTARTADEETTSESSPDTVIAVGPRGTTEVR